MGLFDKFTQSSGQSSNEATFVFQRLPQSLAEMQAMPEASLDTPFKAAALTLCALCAYAASPAVGIEMLNFLRGPAGNMSPTDLQFLRDRFMDGKHYVPFSYFAGATPDNNYTPNQPFTVRISANPYSYQNEGYATLYISSGGADSPRPVTLRLKPSTNQWFLNQQNLMVGIRMPKANDPWA